MKPRNYFYGVCLHCRTHRHVHSRGLCRTCSRRHAAGYPLVAPSDRRPKPQSNREPCGRPHTHRGTGHGKMNTKAEFLPTDAPPGSEEKKEVMRRRAELCQPIFHPGDMREYHQASPPKEKSAEITPELADEIWHAFELGESRKSIAERMRVNRDAVRELLREARR